MLKGYFSLGDGSKWTTCRKPSNLFNMQSWCGNLVRSKHALTYKTDWTSKVKDLVGHQRARPCKCPYETACLLEGPLSNNWSRPYGWTPSLTVNFCWAIYLLGIHRNKSVRVRLGSRTWVVTHFHALVTLLSGKCFQESISSILLIFVCKLLSKYVGHLRSYFTHNL